MSRLGRVAQEGDTIARPGFDVLVTTMDGRRISRVRVTRRPDPADLEPRT